jgi:hypothetical protein
MHYVCQSFQQSMANLNSESCHSLIDLLTPEYLGFLMLQVVPRFTGTGTCISPVPVKRNRGILTSLLRLFQHGLTFQPRLIMNIALTKLSPDSNCSRNRDAISARLTGLKLSPG